MVHWNGRVESPRPTGRHVVVGLGTAQLVDHREQVRHVFSQPVRVCGEFVCRALQGAFAAAAVVPVDVDDQGVIQLAHLVDGLDDAPHVVIGVREGGGVHLGHAGVKPLLVSRKAAPCRQGIWPRCQFGIGRNDAHLLLPRERLLAQLVPPLVEFALELGDPVLGCGACAVPVA